MNYVKINENVAFCDASCILLHRENTKKILQKFSRSLAGFIVIPIIFATLTTLRAGRIFLLCGTGLLD